MFVHNCKHGWAAIFHIMYTFVLFLKFADLKERERERRKDGKRIFPCTGSPDGCNSQSWTRPGPGISFASAGDQGPSSWAIFQCFSELISRELDQKWSNSGTNWYPYLILASQCLNHLYKVLALCTSFFFLCVPEGFFKLFFLFCKVDE